MLAAGAADRLCAPDSSSPRVAANSATSARQACCSCSATALVFYRRDHYEPRLAFAIFLVLNVVALCVVRRAVWRMVKRLRRRGLNHSRAVIVGCDRTGRLTAETIARNAWTGLEAVGFVDDAPQAPRRGEPTVLPRLGSVSELAAVVRRYDVDHVFVALPLARYGELPRVYELNDLLVEVQLAPTGRTWPMSFQTVESTKTRRSSACDLIRTTASRRSPSGRWISLSARRCSCCCHR